MTGMCAILVVTIINISSIIYHSNNACLHSDISYFKDLVSLSASSPSNSVAIIIMEHAEI